MKFGDIFGTQLGYLSASSPATVPHSSAPWHRVRCPKLMLTGTKKVSRGMRTLIPVLLPPELGPSVLLSTQNHWSSWQWMVHGHGRSQVSMEGPAKGTPGRRQRAAGYRWEPGPEEHNFPLKGEPPNSGDEAFPCVSLPLDILVWRGWGRGRGCGEGKCWEPALPAAVLGRVLVSPVVCFGLELALVQQGEQLGDLLQGRKSLLSPGLATQAASCQDVPPSPSAFL